MIMRRGTLLWTLFPPLLLILVVTLALVTGFAGRSMRHFFMERTANELENLARVSGPQFVPLVTAPDQVTDHAATQDWEARGKETYASMASKRRS